MRESLKNLLLVLYTGTQDTAPILVRDVPEGSRQALLWSMTYTQLERFMPNLMDQLFPPPLPPPVHREASAEIPSSTYQPSVPSALTPKSAQTGACAQLFILQLSIMSRCGFILRKSLDCSISWTCSRIFSVFRTSWYVYIYCFLFCASRILVV